MFNQKLPAFLSIFVTAAALVGLSLLLLAGNYNFTALAHPVSPTTTPSPQTRLEVWQGATDTLDFAGGLTTDEVEAVLLADFRPFGEDTVGGATVLMGQDLLEDAGCVANPGAGQANVPPSAFHQTQASASEFRFWPEAGYLYSTSSNSITLTAPVYLPDGATLTHIAKVFFDSEATNVTVRLIRKNLVSPNMAREQMVGFFSSSTSTTQVLCASKAASDLTPGTETISSNYGYFVVLEFPANISSDLNQLELGLKIYYNPPTGPNSGIEAISAGAFRHNGNNGDHWLLSYYSPDAFIRSTGAATPCLTAPVYPPNGTIFTKFEASFRDVDSTPGRDLIVELRRLDQATGSVDVIAQVKPVPPNNIVNANALTSTIVSTATLVSDSYAYYVTTCLPSNPGDNFDILLFGARLLP